MMMLHSLFRDIIIFYISISVKDSILLSQSLISTSEHEVHTLHILKYIGLKLGSVSNT